MNSKFEKKTKKVTSARMLVQTSYDEERWVLSDPEREEENKELRYLEAEGE